MSGPSHRPLVTVAVVTLNAAAELPGTLRSIRRQGWAEMEVLVVDGGSTDATLDIVREPGSGVTRWVSGPDRGPYDAMNKAASIAAGWVSCSTTSWPDCAYSWTMPRPIAPAPTTPIRLKGEVMGSLSCRF